MRFTRQLHRSTLKVRQDIIDTSKITREDIVDSVRTCVTKQEAIAAVTALFTTLPNGVASLKGDKAAALDRVLSDLDSYKRWDDDSKS